MVLQCQVLEIVAMRGSHPDGHLVERHRPSYDRPLVGISHHDSEPDLRACPEELERGHPIGPLIGSYQRRLSFGR